MGKLFLCNSAASGVAGNGSICPLEPIKGWKRFSGQGKGLRREKDILFSGLRNFILRKAGLKMPYPYHSRLWCGKWLDCHEEQEHEGISSMLRRSTSSYTIKKSRLAELTPLNRAIFLLRRKAEGCIPWFSCSFASE